MLFIYLCVVLNAYIFSLCCILQFYAVFAWMGSYLFVFHSVARNNLIRSVILIELNNNFIFRWQCRQ